ncbi:MAG: hypothetical protein AAGF11_25450 [Myxococcota bacterium]
MGQLEDPQAELVEFVELGGILGQRLGTLELEEDRGASARVLLLDLCAVGGEHGVSVGDL